MVICIGIIHSGNLGAIARLCDNYQVQQLILVNPQCEINDEAYERATNGKHYLENIVIHNSLDVALSHADLSVALSARIGGENSLTRSSIPIQQIPSLLSNKVGTIALVLGQEDKGLTNKQVDKCDILSFIPLPGENPVFNISHALAVAFWELIREMPLDDLKEQRLMTHDERKAFMMMLDKILPHTWIKSEKYYGIRRVFQTLLGRSFVTRREANALIGTLRGILRSLEGPHPPWDNHD